MKLRIAILAFATILFASCQKDDGPDNPQEESVYLTTTTGSTWTYKVVDSSDEANPTTSDYAMESTDSDTTIDGHSYHVYSLSSGGSRYLRQEGDSYYQFGNVPGIVGEGVEMLYLKSNLAEGATWEQDISVPVEVNGVEVPLTFTLTNEIDEKGITHTVNGIEYSNVIKVETKITSPALGDDLDAEIESYYAEGYGLIENDVEVSVSILGTDLEIDTHTMLQAAVLNE